MTTATFTQPDNVVQSASAYKANIDAGFRVFSRSGGWFSAHQQDQGSPAPEMSVRIDAGALFDGTTLTEVAAQTVSGFTTPSAGQTRVDRVVINVATGAATRVAGTAVSGSPSGIAPSITDRTMPCCQIVFADTSVVITNSMIVDERLFQPHIGNLPFPAAQVSSSNPNMLDDYEEGSWSPSVGGTSTYNSQIGSYTKIGNRVIIQGTMAIAGIGTGNTSTITNLPFSAIDSGGIFVCSSIGLVTAVVSISAVTTDGTTNLVFRSRTGASVSDSVNALFQNSAAVEFGGEYRTAG